MLNRMVCPIKATAPEFIKKKILKIILENHIAKRVGDLADILTTSINCVWVHEKLLYRKLVAKWVQLSLKILQNTQWFYESGSRFFKSFKT